MIKWPETNNSSRLRCIRVAIGRETKRERVLIVSYRLMQIAGMAERAAAAGWCITTLAEQNGVSVPTLERFFHDTKKLSPREWINAERMRRAGACLMAGRNVQETPVDLGYGSQHGFSLAFKKFFGYPPSLHRKMMEDGKWKSKVEGRESRASEGRARHSVCAEPRNTQHAKSEIGNHSSWSQIRL